MDRRRRRRRKPTASSKLLMNSWICGEGLPWKKFGMRTN